jgi:NAD(P)-dependent dehydrogenase (short-subunit alcohol dehydrogenase family)
MRKPRVVVITGASAGVGRATALEFARRGVDVAMIARDPQALEDAAADVRALGVRALSIALDVSESGALDSAAARVEAEFGPIDVWVNNAMLTSFARFADMPERDFRRITDVTYLGFVWGTMAALKRMTPRNRGVIVQVGSALAYRSIPLQSAYCGAKHAIRGFTDSLRCELHHAKSRIHLTMVQMPALNTPQFDWARSAMPHAPRPVAPIYEPEVAARAIWWAATHRRRELWVGISSVKAIVANAIIPGLLDVYLGRTGFRAQQDPALSSGERPGNLSQPVTELHRVHGRFTDEAKRASASFWVDTHRGLLLCAGLGLGAIIARLMRRRA